MFNSVDATTVRTRNTKQIYIIDIHILKRTMCIFLDCVRDTKIALMMLMLKQREIGMEGAVKPYIKLVFEVWKFLLQNLRGTNEKSREKKITMSIVK